LFLRAAEGIRRLCALLRFFKWTRQLDRPEARGLRLLRAWLSPKQRDHFDAFRYFDVTGSATGQKYRIHFGVSGNVQEIGEDGVEAVLHARSPSAAGRCNACSKDRFRNALAVANQFIRPAVTPLASEDSA
jgi:hypothetical protein